MYPAVEREREIETPTAMVKKRPSEEGATEAERAPGDSQSQPSLDDEMLNIALEVYVCGKALLLRSPVVPTPTKSTTPIQCLQRPPRYSASSEGMSRHVPERNVDGCGAETL